MIDTAPPPRPMLWGGVFAWTRKPSFVWLIAPVLLVASATRANTESAPKDFYELSANQWLISPQQLAEHLEDPGWRIIHVGHGRRGYERGHIPGAVFLDFDEVYINTDTLAMEMPTADAVQRLIQKLGIDRVGQADPAAANPDDATRKNDAEDSAGRVVLVGDASGVFPARFLITLAHFGFGDRVSLLDGQLKGWQAAGYAVEPADPEDDGGQAAQPNADPPAPTRDDPAHSGNPSETAPVREAAPVPGVLADRSAVEAALAEAASRPVPAAGDAVVPARAVDPSAAAATVVLDVRPAAQFIGEKRGPGVDVSGRIDGAVNLPWQDWFTGHNPPWLRDPADIRRQLADVGISHETQVIVYDTAGIHASLAWAVLRHLGYQASMYDGGFEDWSRDWPRDN